MGKKKIRQILGQNRRILRRKEYRRMNNRMRKN